MTHVTLPPLFAVRAVSSGRSVRKLSELSRTITGAIVPFQRKGLSARLFKPDEGEEILLLPKTKKLPSSWSGMAIITASEVSIDRLDMSRDSWAKHPVMSKFEDFDFGAAMEADRASWRDAFQFVQEDPTRNVIGLRRPQLGALHATHAHWSVNTSPATVVMPTGTGKTDVMIALLVSLQCQRILIIVPTDALRTQLADKFVALGVLSRDGARNLASGSRFPVVLSVYKAPRSPDEADALFRTANVIITTSSLVSQCDPSVQDRMAESCSHLFIDEAHHVEAPTWRRFKDRFRSRLILQFTATPFREDGKSIDGDVIYKYSLRRAQEDGYFKPIKFVAVSQYVQSAADEEIAAKAVAQLKVDLDKGHIVMARVDSVERAKAILKIYENYPEFNPVGLHSGIKSQEARDAARASILSGRSRIVVCVDMLGEGFDLPELKIAAFHDIRKSLAVTLQLAGRFTRSRPDLGDATFIANVADVSVQEELRKLYTRDPDWNVLLPALSEEAIGEELALQRFVSGFSTFPTDIPLKQIRPATSAVVYRVLGDQAWNPMNYKKGIPGLEGCAQVFETINDSENTLLIVTARRVQLRWTDSEALADLVWEMFLVIWDPDQKLLFINSSSNSGEFAGLARAVCGEVAMIDGQDVFKVFGGVTRLRLQNVGLSEQLGRNVRYTGRMGADVETAMTDVQRRGGMKAVLAGSGFEAGKKVAIGASRRGRVWSFRREPVNHFVAWCKTVGAKLISPAIDSSTVLAGTLRTDTVSALPALIPVFVDWPEEVYQDLEKLWSLEIDGTVIPIGEVSLEVVHAEDGVVFEIVAEEIRVPYRLRLYSDEQGVAQFEVLCSDRRTICMRRGSGEARKLTEFLYSCPPVIGFANGSMLQGNEYVELRGNVDPFDCRKIDAWDWTGTNIREESQGVERNAMSVQARVIRELMKDDYAVIFDDDSSGEIADVVAIRQIDQARPKELKIDLYHCKFSGDNAPGARVGDLYEVCGQAQKCISWMSKPERQTDMLTHLLRRDAKRLRESKPTRFERGDRKLLETFREKSRTSSLLLRVFIIQPGLSKGRASRDQLELLSVTENHLMETYQIEMKVVASP